MGCALIGILSVCGRFERPDGELSHSLTLQKCPWKKAMPPVPSWKKENIKKEVDHLCKKNQMKDDKNFKKEIIKKEIFKKEDAL